MNAGFSVRRVAETNVANRSRTSEPFSFTWLAGSVKKFSKYNLKRDATTLKWVSDTSASAKKEESANVPSTVLDLMASSSCAFVNFGYMARITSHTNFTVPFSTLSHSGAISTLTPVTSRLSVLPSKRCGGMFSGCCISH